MKKNILIAIDHYLPGYNAGGPIQSVANIVDALQKNLDFTIVTRNYDCGSQNHPYPNITLGEKIKVGAAKVIYLDETRLKTGKFLTVFNNTDYDMLYLNSLFSWEFTTRILLFKKLRLIRQRPIIIAPRGELNTGALNIKKLKKQLFIRFAQLIGLYKNVTWHASTELEASDIKRVFGTKNKIMIAPNLPHPPPPLNLNHKTPKITGHLKMVFLSRISPKKNLLQAIKSLSQLKGTVVFDIYGPISDQTYWQQCLQAINKLPNNITVTYMGAITNDQVNKTLTKYHLFYLPTLGENFGHAIYDALGAGCPILISNKTPWLNLADHKVGWDLAISDIDGFKDILQKVINMDGKDLESLSKNAYAYAIDFYRNDELLALNRGLFK